MSNETCFVSSRAALEIAKNANEDSVILIGQTGGGKSSIGNALLGFSISIEQSDREFPEGRSLTAMTDELKVVAGRFLESGEELTVIDTPGFLDTENRSAFFMAALVDFLSEFPKDRLRLIVITIPLTEPRANSTYQDMFDEIALMFADENQKIWDHVMFVFTCRNFVSDEVDIDRRKREWIDRLKDPRQVGIPNPNFCEFLYGQPDQQFGLRPLVDLFKSLDSFTPKVTQEMHEYLASNPHATVEERIKHSRELEEIQKEFQRKLEELRDKSQKTQERYKKVKNKNKEFEVKFEAQREKTDALNARLIELASRPPQVIYRGGGGGSRGCTIC